VAVFRPVGGRFPCKSATRTLGEICDEINGVIQTGPFGSQLHQKDYVDEGVPVVMPKDIIDGRISHAQSAKVREADAQRLLRHRLQPGEIVYGRRGDIGRQALITETESGWLCGTGCLRISLGNSIVDPSFLHYYLRQPSVITWISNQAIGATMPNLNTTILRSVPISYPRLCEQRQIASTLESFDLLITNNGRRAEVVDQMAQLIYSEWFVHFRFPGGDGAQSEMGHAPVDWAPRPLSDIMDFANGAAIKPGGAGPYLAYGSNGVIGHSESSNFQNAVIIGRVGAYCGSVVHCPDRFWASDNSIVASPKDKSVSSTFLFLLLQDMKLRRYAGGSAQPLLTQAALKPLETRVAPADVLRKFDLVAIPLMEAKTILEQKNESLRAMRDLLIVRLMSGELEVSDLFEMRDAPSMTSSGRTLHTEALV